MTDFIQVETTTGSEQEAQEIAAALVERRLAACAQVTGPLTSVYRWQGRIEHSQEWLCTLKSRQSRFAEVEKAIQELHSYECPEILATPISAGFSAYLEWLGEGLE